MELKILTNRNNYITEIENLKKDWINQIICYFGIKPDELNLNNSKLIELLLKNKLEIIDYPAQQALEIKYKSEVVAEWAAPKLKLMKNKEGYFYEITIENWSVLDEQIET